MRRLGRGRVGLALLVLALIGSGCVGARHTASGTTVRVEERDFAISMPARLRAGTTTFRVHNSGPDDHEFILVRADGRLPMRADDITVDEDAVAASTVGVLEPGPPGSTRSVRTDLHPGRYVVLCNMSGHFMGGMYKTLTVT